MTSGIAGQATRCEVNVSLMQTDEATALVYHAARREETRRTPGIAASILAPLVGAGEEDRDIYV